jgi:hypothetical protein
MTSLNYTHYTRVEVPPSRGQPEPLKLGALDADSNRVLALRVPRFALLVAIVAGLGCHAAGGGGQSSAAAVPDSFGALRSSRRTATIVREGGATILRLDERATDGVAWTTDSTFDVGTIRVAIRGRDLLQRSFVGVAFAGVNDSTYEAVYLRPFNFRATDSTRHAHAIQYIAAPSYPWERLRREHPGVFERGIEPAPDPNGWVMLRVVVARDSVYAFVDDARNPALAVRRLAPARPGYLGYWVGAGSSGDFRAMTRSARGG